jgi:hypothetical protein
MELHTAQGGEPGGIATGPYGEHIVLETAMGAIQVLNAAVRMYPEHTCTERTRPEITARIRMERHHLGVVPHRQAHLQQHLRITELVGMDIHHAILGKGDAAFIHAGDRRDRTQVNTFVYRGHQHTTVGPAQVG